MGFLDKINAAKNMAAAAEKKVNPLLLKRTPTVPAPAPTTQAMEAALPTTRINPLARKAAPVAPAAAAKEEMTEEPKEASVEYAKTAEAPPSPVEETVPIEEASAETKAETLKTAAKSKPRSGSKKAAAKTSPTDVSVAAASEDIAEMPESTMSFSEVAETMSSPMIDEEWTAFRENIETELNAIVIDMDMNPGTLKVVLSELNAIYDQIAQPLHQSKTLLENLTNKEDGALQVIKSINTGTGNNDMERKKAGYVAAMNYKSRSGGLINLFDAAAEARSRYNFLKGIYDRIQYKNSMLITMNGALKLERDFTAAS